jgi:hypothetical protein
MADDVVVIALSSCGVCGHAKAVVSDAWNSAFKKMVATTPQTSVGAVALIDAFIESEGGFLVGGRQSYFFTPFDGS